MPAAGRWSFSGLRSCSEGGFVVGVGLVLTLETVLLGALLFPRWLTGANQTLIFLPDFFLRKHTEQTTNALRSENLFQFQYLETETFPLGGYTSWEWTSLE